MAAMWQLLGSVVNTFLLLRDLFGYLIPGFVLAAIVAWKRHLDWAHALAQQWPIWADAVVAGLVCYVVGHLLVAIGYTIYIPFNEYRKFQEDGAAQCRSDAEHVVPANADQAAKDAIAKKRADAWAAQQAKAKAAADAFESEFIYYRHLYPQLFHDVDRRGTIAILRIGLAVALLTASFFVGEVAGWVAFAVGLLMVRNGYTGLRHVDHQQRIVLAAAKQAAESKLPYFRWNSAEKEEKGEDAKTDAKDDLPKSVRRRLERIVLKRRA